VYYPQVKVSAGTVIERNGKLLLVKRAQNPWKGCWYLPAGYLEAGEDPRTGAARETYEETGLTVRSKKLLEIYYFDDDPRGSGILILYEADILEGELRGSPEGQELGFFSAQDLPEHIAGAGHDRAVHTWRATRMGVHADPDRR